MGLTILLTMQPFSVAQVKDKGPPLKPTEVFAQVRNLIDDGKYDLAALFLQKFIDNTPTNADLLTLEERYGPTVFQSLRNVPRWSDNAALDKKSRANVETIIKQATAATESLLRNPGRVNKYIRNLGASYEERVFAEMVLKRTGDYAIPFMVEALRAKLDPAISTGIIGAIQKLDAPTMAGWIAALDGLDDSQQYSVIATILSRPDMLTLLSAAQTDFAPYLWKLVGDPNGNPALKKFAETTLAKYVPAFDKRKPEAELVAAARKFAEHKARYAGAKTNPDGSPTTVPVWEWDTKEQKLHKREDVPAGQADEYFGLRYARWALEQKPNYEPAQILILTIATERAVIRSNFGDIAKTDPAVYKMLADAPLTVLTDLLDRSLFEKRTALVLALTQVLGDRAEKGPALSAPGKPSLFERALNYGDPRVQLAGANALLRSPVPVDPRLRGDVIRVLRRAAAIDQGVPGSAKGQALIADPDRKRADHTAQLLREQGYDTEIFSTGRELLRRVARASDFDLIVIDHHIPNPELVDLVSHLRVDVNAARRPILVTASTDRPVPPSLDMLLLRLAGLIAATETESVPMPPAYVPDLRRTPDEQALDRSTIQKRRDGVFKSAGVDRLDRLMRVVDTTGLELTAAQKFMLKLRAAQITFAVLAVEHPISPESAPEAYRDLQLLNKQIITQPPVPAYIRRVGIEQLMKIIERLEVDVAKVPDVMKRYDFIRAHVTAEDLGLNVQRTRDPIIEAKVSRLMRNFPAVAVIPEPYTRVGFEDDVKAAFADPADAPRDPAEKKAGAKLAIEWLSKMATGEVTGFDVKSAEPELLAALRIDDLAEPAIEAVSRSASAESQQGLISLALTGNRPVDLRLKAADAAIRHVQTRGKLTPQTLVDPVIRAASTEQNADLRGKFQVLRSLLAPDPKAYLNDLKTYSPMLSPVVPKAPEPKPKGPGMGDPNLKK